MGEESEDRNTRKAADRFAKLAVKRVLKRDVDGHVTLDDLATKAIASPAKPKTSRPSEK